MYTECVLNLSFFFCLLTSYLFQLHFKLNSHTTMFPRCKFQHQPGFQTLHIRNSTWSAASRVPMAYELHKPPYTEKESSFISKDPILILHGFLGSRRENKFLGRYVAFSQPTVYCVVEFPFRTLAEDLARPVFTLVSVASNLFWTE